MAAFDLDLFAKVRRLHDSTTNAGEKAAAAARMTILARKAGLTLQQALSKLDAPLPAAHDPLAGSLFSKAWADLINSPQHRTFEARLRLEREARQRDAVAIYGSEESLFAETAWEVRLRLACEPLIEPRPIINGFTDSLAGWKSYEPKMPARVRAAVSGAYVLPASVAQAWSEREAWEELADDRAAFDRCYGHPDWVNARQAVLEELLDQLPAAGADDVMARLAWLRAVTTREWSRDVKEDTALIDRLAADVTSMAGVVTALAGMVERASQQETASAAVQNGHEDHASQHSAADVHSGRRHRTNADKRRDVLSLLSQGLKDREVARRVGVSPTTVGSIRNAQNGR